MAPIISEDQGVGVYIRRPDGEQMIWHQIDVAILGRKSKTDENGEPMRRTGCSGKGWAILVEETAEGELALLQVIVFPLGLLGLKNFAQASRQRLALFFSKRRLRQGPPLPDHSRSQHRLEAMLVRIGDPGDLKYPLSPRSIE